MVQVDVFWSYALGATFASAACRQLKDDDKPFYNKYFVYTVLYLACIFAPSGVYLLWNFPHWETMQVARSHADIPAWLVVVFAVTNITQGILGYWVCYKFIQKGRYYAAHLQWFLGYLCMFFILLYGWDGTGWQRFLYDATMHGGTLWSPGIHDGLGFITSNVCLTLFVMGLFVIPFMGVPVAVWIKEGARMDDSLPGGIVPEGMAGSTKIWNLLLVGVFVFSLGSSAIAAIIVHFIGKAAGNLGIGFLVGIPIFGILVYFGGIRKPMPFYGFFKKLFLAEPAA